MLQALNIRHQIHTIFAVMISLYLALVLSFSNNYTSVLNLPTKPETPKTTLAEGLITGDLDFEKFVQNAAFAGFSHAASSYTGSLLAESDIGLSTKSPLDASNGLLSSHKIATGATDILTDAALKSAIYGTDFGDNFLDGTRNFAFDQITSATHFGIGEIRGGEGSLFGIGLHMGAGCALSEMRGGDCAAGAASAGLSDLTTGVLHNNGATREEIAKASEVFNPTFAALTSKGDANQFNINTGINTSATQNNYLNHREAAKRAQALRELHQCEQSGDCTAEEIASLEKEVTYWDDVSQDRDDELVAACETNRNGAACREHVRQALVYAEFIGEDPLGDTLQPYDAISNYNNSQGEYQGLLAEGELDPLGEELSVYYGSISDEREKTWELVSQYDDVVSAINIEEAGWYFLEGLGGGVGKVVRHGDELVTKPVDTKGGVLKGKDKEYLDQSRIDELSSNHEQGGKTDLAEGIGGARYEDATGNTLTRSETDGVDFYDGEKALSLKGPLVNKKTGDAINITDSNVDGLANSVIKDSKYNTASDAIVVDTTGMTDTQRTRLQNKVSEGIGDDGKEVVYLE